MRNHKGPRIIGAQGMIPKEYGIISAQGMIPREYGMEEPPIQL